jgi:hypothetical protein
VKTNESSFSSHPRARANSAAGLTGLLAASEDVSLDDPAADGLLAGSDRFAKLDIVEVAPVLIGIPPWVTTRKRLHPAG